jgi:hypothetical protein
MSFRSLTLLNVKDIVLQASATALVAIMSFVFGCIISNSCTTPA